MFISRLAAFCFYFFVSSFAAGAGFGHVARRSTSPRGVKILPLLVAPSSSFWLVRSLARTHYCSYKLNSDLTSTPGSTWKFKVNAGRPPNKD